MTMGDTGLRPADGLAPPLVQIGKDLLFYFPARVIPVVTGLLAISAYTRLLAPQEYGWYALVTVTISLVHTVAFTWLGYVLWRYFERYQREQQVERFLSTALFAAALIFVVAAPTWYLVTVALAPHLHPHFTHLLRVGIVALAAQVAYGTLLTILQVTRASFRYSLYAAANSLGTLVIALGLIHFLSWGAQAILWASAVVMIGLCLVELRLARYDWHIRPALFSTHLLRNLASFGLAQVGISVGALLLASADRYLIELLRNTEEVGIYSAGYAVADMSIQIPVSVLMLGSLPVVVQTFERGGEERTQGLLTTLLRVLIIALVPAVFGMAAVADDVVRVVLGEAFRPAAPLLPWLAAGSLLFGFSQYSNLWFQLKERPRMLLYLVALAAVVNIALNLALIPRLGVRGAAYATLIAYATYMAASYAVSARLFPLVVPWGTLGKAVVASLAMYLLLRQDLAAFGDGAPSLAFEIALGVLSYAVVLAVLREQALWQAINRVRAVVRTYAGR